MQAVGAVTIGQSPRVDALPEILELLPGGTPVVERGALDDMDSAEIARLGPAAGEGLLVTRLRDGTEVALAEARLLPLVQDAVDHVVDHGAAVVAVLCTGALPGICCARPLLMPGVIVRNLVAAVARDARLGVVVPDPEQVKAADASWSEVSAVTMTLAASPYGPPDAVARAAVALAQWHPDIVVLDCLGFGRQMKQMVAESVRVPVILPRTALAGAIAAVL